MRRVRASSMVYRGTLTTILLFFAYFLVWSDVGAVRYYHVRRQINIARRELVAVQEEVSGVEAAIDKWRNDPFYLEKVAREELGMGYPDEVVYFYQKS